jgi:phosphotransferase system HPr (HPr) family protein
VKHIRLVVTSEVGLHARPAAVFVAEAALFASAVQVRNLTTNSGWVDGKSVLSVLTLGVEQGHEIEMTVEGEDEAQASEALEALIRADFAGRL